MSGYFEILAHEETSLGVLCLRRRELLGRPGTFATEITLNHEFLMSSYNTASERALADCALEFLGGDSNDVRVLVGGLASLAVSVLSAGHDVVRDRDRD